MIDFTRKGRMISSSKTAYCLAHPNHAVCFNANILTINRGKIWWGDLDLTKDAGDLQQFAQELKETIYVLPELQHRLDRAIMSFAP